ncbi:MAG: 30S ribosomal protein S9 [Candidatus Harrisonbacteria bacterium]|nr:30S ribosomal protein S9 [Candidatus Harrisonbacteria bacterium]
MVNKPAQKISKSPQYFQARGGRKTAYAFARVLSGKGELTVNSKNYKDYFRIPKNQKAASAPFDILNIKDKVSASVKVSGGGINAQAEAVRNAVARALAKFDVNLKSALRRAGFLTRDSRMVERKKYGLKKARRAPQWAKR